MKTDKKTRYNGDADLASDLQEDARNSGEVVYDQKGNILHSDFEDDQEDQEDHHIHNVTSDPPDRFPHEEEFSEWLHSHPIHESDHDWQGAKQMGFDDLHSPGDSEDDDEEYNEEPQTDDRGQESRESPSAGSGPEGAESAEGDSESNPEESDTSYLDDWGSAGVRRADADAGGDHQGREEEKPR